LTFKKVILIIKQYFINKVFYYDGKQAALDILNFKIIHSKKFDKNLKDLAEKYNNKLIPIMPVRAEDLINKYNIVEGKQLGSKLKLIEDEWVKNNFSISDEQVEYIINN